MHEMKYFNLLAESPDEAVERIDDIGGPHSHSNYPWGWAQAGNTPFKWYKQNTHEGGVHVPLIVHWPDRITEGGGLRHQFHHVSDLVPTIYEILGVEAPATYRGREQIPVSGTSLQYSFDRPDEPSHKHVQYFEMMGHRGIYADGWKAVTRHQPGVPFEDDDWELYHLDRDHSECRNLAGEQPDKVAELVDLWWSEAEEFGRPAARRPHHRAVLHPVPRPVPPPHQPPLHLLPPDVTAARPGRPGPGWTRLGHGGHHRPAGGSRRRALCLRQRELRGQPVRPGRPPGLRLQLLRGPPRGRVGGDRPAGPVGRRGPVPPHRTWG